MLAGEKLYIKFCYVLKLRQKRTLPIMVYTCAFSILELFSRMSFVVFLNKNLKYT